MGSAGSIQGYTKRQANMRILATKIHKKSPHDMSQRRVKRLILRRYYNREIPARHSTTRIGKQINKLRPSDIEKGRLR